MNDILYANTRMFAQRAAHQARENEILRRQAEREVSRPDVHPTRFAGVTERFLAFFGFRTAHPAH